MDPISNPVIAKKQSYDVVLSKLEGERVDLNNPVATPASKLEGERADLNNPVAAPASKPVQEEIQEIPEDVGLDDEKWWRDNMDEILEMFKPYDH
ncbi:hypothetical protein HanPSC8_Chr10g0442591 [Helianthus annuus]|nr:hypothetical protein HanPSC8_Chr10g0442591 [Helianthus annuus]